MPACFLRAGKGIDVATKAVDIVQCRRRQKSLDLGEIAERRAGQRVLTIERPSELAGIERNGHFVLHWRKEGLRQIKVRPALRVEGPEKPKLVFDNGTANVATDIRFREAIGRRSREREVLHG